MTDYIKREDAIKTMAQYLMEMALIDNPEASDRIEEWEGNVVAPIMSTVNAADVRENVKAEKVISKHAVDDITTRWFECDVCGQAVDLMDNFCKNCGARFVP